VLPDAERCQTHKTTIPSYLLLLSGKFACRILIQSVGYALPVNITVPVVISLLIAICGLRNGDPCYFSGTIPDYLFFESPPYYFLEEYLAIEVKNTVITELQRLFFLFLANLQSTGWARLN
jgi:hypothetical protein